MQLSDELSAALKRCATPRRHIAHSLHPAPYHAPREPPAIRLRGNRGDVPQAAPRRYRFPAHTLALTSAAARAAARSWRISTAISTFRLICRQLQLKTEVKEQVNQPDDHRSAPTTKDQASTSSRSICCHSERPSSTNPDPRHTTNPPIPCLGDSPSAGRPAADFGTASPCGWPLVWTPTGDASLVFAGQPMQRKCATTQTTTSSGCSRQRTLHVPVVFPAERSIGQLRGASCKRRGSAIGSGFSLRSWSAGSASKRLLRRLQRRGG